MHSDVAIIIPSRLGSNRLPEKPLQLIGSSTMVEHVVNSVLESGIKNTYVATDSEFIIDKVKGIGGNCIFVDDECNTGTDRVYKAFLKMPNADKINYIINVQGDMPFIDPKVITKVIEHLKIGTYEVITPVTKVGKDVANSHSNVKVVVNAYGQALYFSRQMIPYAEKEFLYHIGVYGFTKKALSTFVNLPQSQLEKTEQLEQLRALENGLQIGVCYVDDIPISVDTEEDLKKAVKFYYTRFRDIMTPIKTL